MALKLASLEIGDIIEIELDRYHTEHAVFLELTGEGEGRTVKLVTASERGKLVTWWAYRHEGRWAYGSSAGRIAFVTKIIQ